MSIRIFLSLALLCLAVTSVRSYGPYGHNERIDHGLPHFRHCPTCPPSFSGASRWCESPIVHGQYQDFEDHSSCSASQGCQRDSSNCYGYPYCGGSNPCANSRCSHGRCHSRLARSDNASPEGFSTPDGSPYMDESFDHSGSLGSTGARGVAPHDYSRSSPDSFIPESYRDAFGVTPIENRRVSSHYGNGYRDSIRKNENPGVLIYGERLKAIEGPDKKKVYVVYRADADDSMNDQDFDASPVNASTLTRHKMEKSAIEDINSMNDSELKELMRKTIAFATRRKIRDEELDGRQQRRGMHYNEQESESYNPRRPYNDALYQRFNSEDTIDRQQRRKLRRAGLESPEVVHTPAMRFNPYVLPEATGIPNNPTLSGSIQEDSAQDNERYDASGKSTSEQQEFRTSHQEKHKKKPEIARAFATRKRETDSVTKSQPAIDNKAHGQSTDVTGKRFSGQDENKGKGVREQNATRMSPNIRQKDAEVTTTGIYPDFEDVMEIPPVGDSEIELHLNFENSTPSPTN